jgi:hypothetical protein
VTKLGRRRGERPILVKFTSFAVELEALRNKNLAGLQILVDKDFPLEARRIMENLIPNLKDGNKFGLEGQ